MFKSLFTRLSLSFFITLIAIFAIISVAFNQMLKEEPNRQFSEKLLRYMVTDMAKPPSPQGLRRFTSNLGISLVVTGGGYYWESEQGLLQPDAIEKLTTPDTRFEFLRVSKIGTVVLLRQGNYNYYITEFQADLSLKSKIVLLVSLLLLALVFFLNYRFIHWLFHPIKQLRSDIQKISEGDIDHDLQTKRNDELGELIQAVNAMTEKLRANIGSKRELLLAISHELRSPLARAKMNLELMTENETNKPYKTKLNDNLNDINTLIEALLQSEGLSNTSNVLNIVDLNLSLLIQQVVREHDSNRIKLKLPNNQCQIEADELRIKLLISNIIGNALQYSDEIVEIELKNTGKEIICSICDHGEGIAKEEIPKITEAFYRPDKSRQRKTGKHGFGLYLCQKIVDAFGWKMEITSKQGEGTCITLRAPLLIR